MASEIGHKSVASDKQASFIKTTETNRPFLKDIIDLFSTLIVSTELSEHRQFFRTYRHSFTTENALQNLASLKLFKSNRTPDPKDPSRLITTTTTTSFSMAREHAKLLCQHFMDGHLIQNAADPSSTLFKDRGIYHVTPKGLHILERFVTENGINPQHLLDAFLSQPICPELYTMKRRSTDDEIIVTQSVITTLFRRFVGRQPRYYASYSPSEDPVKRLNETSKGILLSDVEVVEANTIYNDCFTAMSAVNWLLDFTSAVNKDEAAEIAAHFVRFDLIQLVSDRRKWNDNGTVYTVRGAGTSKGNNQIGQFLTTSKALYRVTEEGRRVARWDGLKPAPHNKSQVNLAAESGDKSPIKETSTERLKYILEEPALRSVFREFLRSNFCEENLAFWLEVEDFKRKFNVTSSAAALGRTGLDVQAPMERRNHEESLINAAFGIYNTFLSPTSQTELNIDHKLHQELVHYLEGVITEKTGTPFKGDVKPEQAAAFRPQQLGRLLQFYYQIQVHIFRLMATDSLPKFVRTPAFLGMQDSINPDIFNDVLSSASGNEETGGVQVTLSQIARERERQ